MKTFFGILFALIAVILAWLAVWVILPRYYTSPAEAGQLGDSFGLITSLFGGLTLIGAGYAVYAQNKQLMLAHSQDAAQQEQLRIAREQRSEDAIDREKTLKYQASQAMAQRLASELNAYDSLVQHYRDKHNRSGSPDHINVDDDYKKYMQMIKIVLSEIQYPDDQFDWKSTFPQNQTRFTKYFLVRMREAKSIYQSLLKEPLKKYNVRSLLCDLRDELRTLILQEGFQEIRNPWPEMAINSIEIIMKDINIIISENDFAINVNRDNSITEDVKQKLDILLLYWNDV